MLISFCIFFFRGWRNRSNCCSCLHSISSSYFIGCIILLQQTRCVSILRGTIPYSTTYSANCVSFLIEQRREGCIDTNICMCLCVLIRIIILSWMSLVIFLLVFLLFFSRIKKHIWPNVPDPSKSVIAQWSPQTPAKVKGKQKKPQN